MKERLNQRVHPALLAAAAGVALASASAAQAQSSWAAAVSDSWFNPARWSPAAVPNSSGTNVTLGLGTAYTVSMQNAGASCNTLTLSNVNATLSIFDNAALNVYGNISNTGLIQISASGAPGNGTLLNAANPIVLSGTGTVRLAAASSNGDSDAAYLYNNGNAANSMTNSAGHTIAGYGRVYNGIINNGTVNADQNGKGLLMIGSPKTNNASITASNGGFVQFRTIGLTQGAGGVCASSNSSPIQFVGASVAGGTLDGAGTGSGIQFYGASSLSGVTLLNTARVTDNSSVSINAGGVINNGTWTVSDPAAPGNNAYVNATDASVTLGGTGTLRLQGIGGGNGDNDSAYLYNNGNAANIFTNATTHSIRGYGRIYAGLVNNGTVNSDIAGKGIILISAAKTNNGTMTASNGGFLQFRGVTVTGNPAAQIISTDAASPVQFVSSTLSGGGFTTAGTGVFQYYGSSTLSNLTVNGVHTVTDNSSVLLATDLVNNGSWKISDPAAPGNNAHFDAAAPVSITGTGTITLQGPQSGNGDNDAAYLYNNANAANTLTLGANQTLNGYGRVHVALINNGLVNANNSPNAGGPTSKGIVFLATPKTNNATITSSNGGFWYFRGITVTNNGLLSSSNTSVSGGGFENCTVNGGTITNVSGQSFGTAGTVGINGSTLTPGSFIQVNDNSTMTSTGLTNNGTILVSNPAAPGNPARINSTSPGTTIGGSGLIRLQGTGNGDNDSAYVYDNGNAANAITQAAPHSINGHGRIFSALTNNGTVNADDAGKYIVMLGSAKTNNATITSSNGGGWHLRAFTLTQGASGVLSTQGASTGGLENATVSGGSIGSSASGPVSNYGSSTLDGVTINTGSVLQISDNSTLNVTANGIVNNGTVLVETLGAPGNPARLVAPGAATISGTGTVRMQATGFANDSAYLWGQSSAANPLTLGSGQAVTGSGRFYGNIVVNGTIAPDQPFGTPTALGLIQPMGSSLTLGGKSVFNCQLGSVASYDALQGTSPVTINPGATLNISIVNPFDPPVGSTYTIVSGSSVTGQFTNTNFQPLINKKQAFLIYGPTFVRLYVTCYVNCDNSTGSPTLTANDFQCFLNRFAQGDPYANCDSSTGTPTLTANDFQCFLNKFAGGCI